MAWKRFIIEFGTGVDVHGIDVTKAAQKAVKDAVSH
ncbi:MAG: Lin0512 family protein, partial [Clostridia bacterium]|nr:Lin0512 family protein [Clostridia bacterium]